MLNSDQLTESMSSFSMGLREGELGITQIRRDIDKCILDNGDFDGSALSSLWFPVDKYDVFISHSHQDLGKVYRLALDLKGKGKRVFVDSFLWGYNEELIKKIKDSTLNLNREEEYNIEKSINLLLVNALSNAVHSSKNFLFINTENSLIEDSQLVRNKIKKDVSSSLWEDANKKTYSPWIMHELTLSRIIYESQRKLAFESVGGMNSYHEKQAKIQLPAEVEHLQVVTLSELNRSLSKKS